MIRWPDERAFMATGNTTVRRSPPQVAQDEDLPKCQFFIFRPSRTASIFKMPRQCKKLLMYDERYAMPRLIRYFAMATFSQTLLFAFTRAKRGCRHIQDAFESSMMAFYADDCRRGHACRAAVSNLSSLNARHYYHADGRNAMPTERRRCLM